MSFTAADIAANVSAAQERIVVSEVLTAQDQYINSQERLIAAQNTHMAGLERMNKLQARLAELSTNEVSSIADSLKTHLAQQEAAIMASSLRAQQEAANMSPTEKLYEELMSVTGNLDDEELRQVIAFARTLRQGSTA